MRRLALAGVVLLVPVGLLLAAPVVILAAVLTLPLPSSTAAADTPAALLSVTSAAGTAATRPGGWGGHVNGRIPPDALCPIDPSGRQRLRCDAAAAFTRLDAAYQARFGVPIAVTDSYRDHASQVALKQSWCDRGACHMAATPGRSNHGWGLALDLGGGINRFASPQHTWMRSHAPAYGWHHPSWARQGGGKEEPWHWEYQTAEGGPP